MEFNLYVKDLGRAFAKLVQIYDGYKSHFCTKTRSVEEQAFKYLHGKFLEKGRGNMTKYSRDVPDCDNQSLQHFISDSPLDERPVIDR